MYPATLIGQSVNFSERASLDRIAANTTLSHIGHVTRGRTPALGELG